jgi:class 3 adenylate cyclase/predicted ATPase
MPEAERRQLTVIFCDLVDSTRLSSQLDPEDYRDVVREYQQVCAEVIQRYDGHIAQYLGDGLLVYFGYPIAHEEDAQRAVHTGLGIVEAIRTLNTRLEPDKGVRLAIRLGIHTGLVVVGEIGGAGRQEQLALGATPNIAARIQGLAAPDTVVLSASTYRLVQGYFECQALGERVLRGVAEPIAIYRAMQESGVQSRLDVASTRGLTPLVGREAEVAFLLERWEQTKDGQGQVSLLSGEAGIGKSRLVQVLKDQVASESHTRWECRSSPYYQNTALYPIIDLIQRTLRWQQDETPEEKLAKLERQLSQYRLPLKETVPLFAPLLSLLVPEKRYPPLNFSPQQQRQKTLESIVAMLLELAEQQPVLFILEDLHWTDPTTLEFLGLLVEHVPAAAICTLLTCRPEFQPSWSHRTYLTEMTVNRLSNEQAGQVVEKVTEGRRLPPAVLQQLIEKSDGVPLYLEEMTKAVLEANVLREHGDHYELTGPLSSLAIPTTLQDSLIARLDRLSAVKTVAQLGATIGRTFAYELLQAVSPLEEARLEHGLQQLMDAELVYQQEGVPPGTYTFKHALIQEAAYQSLLRSTRQQYHQRIAQVLEVQFPAIAATQPELLAQHYTEAGLAEQALPYWQRAGESAVERSAYVEAIAHFTKGLVVLTTLPDTPQRAQYELALQTSLGPALMARKGYGAPEVEQAYTRARELCRQVGETPQLFRVLWGLQRFYLLRAALQTAYELGEQLFTLAQHQQDAALLLEAHRALGHPLFFLGKLIPTREHLEQSLALYPLQESHAHAVLYGRDPRVDLLSYAALVWWLLGYPDQALQRTHAALNTVEVLSHPFSRAQALLWAAWVHQFRHEGSRTQERAQTLITLTGEQGFAQWSASGSILHGWALAVQGFGEAGITQMRKGLAAYQATGAEVFRPYGLVLLAAAYKDTGQTEEGLSVLTKALTTVQNAGGYFYEAELHRLKGELLLQHAIPDVDQAESCFQQALAVARYQQARSLELRAATSLARLWQSQGKRQDAYNLLAPVYNWFTEGFDTADLKDAKALLNELEG